MFPECISIFYSKQTISFFISPKRHILSIVLKLMEIICFNNKNRNTLGKEIMFILVEIC